MIRREDIDENVLVSLNKRDENWQIVEDIKNDLNTLNEDFNSHKLDYANLVVEVKAKADKRQEAWITPTLLNGWENNGTPFFNVGYFKDSLGIVHLRGHIKNGAHGANIFMLPAGYIPTSQMRFAVLGNNVLVFISISNAGAVTYYGANNTQVSLDSISFRVV